MVHDLFYSSVQMPSRGLKAWHFIQMSISTGGNGYFRALGEVSCSKGVYILPYSQDHGRLLNIHLFSVILSVFVKMRSTLSLLVAATCLPLSFCATIFVSPTGSDSAAGSITAPLKSIQSAVTLATPGSTIFLRAGTFALSANVQFTKSGTAALPYTISAYESEKVIIDGESMP